MRRYLHQSQYRLDRILSKGILTQLFLLSLAALVVVAIGMTVTFVGLFDQANEGVESVHHINDPDFYDAFWWALTHALDPGTFITNYGATWPVALFGFALTVVGMALFGTFIGLVSAGINERLRQLDRGIGPVVETGHALILGWNHLAPAVISRLMDETPDMRIVALADLDIDEMRHDLRMSMEIDQKLAARVIFRQGSVVAAHELDRVSYLDAARIIILSNERSMLDPTANDIDAVKLLLMFADHNLWGEKRPHIVAEISDSANQEIANLAGSYQVPVVTSSDMISRIMAQCSRRPDLSLVYSELFSSNRNKLVMEHIPQCTGLTFGEVLNRFDKATPIGVCDILELDDRVVYIPDLNSPADHVIEEQERIILISSTDKPSLLPEPEKPSPLPVIEQGTETSAPYKKILILGWNRNIYTMLNQYDEYLRDGGEVRIICSLDPEEAQDLLTNNLPKPLANISCRIEQANYLKKPLLTGMIAKGPESVVVLSDESVTSENPDSRVIMAMILLQWIINAPETGNRPHVVAEILDKSSKNSLDFFSGFEMVVTPDIVSLMLSQISRRNDLRTVTTELLSPNGQEIYLKPVDQFVASGTAFRFGDLLAAGKEQGDIIWGYVRCLDPHDPDGGQEEVVINPDRKVEITLNPQDKLITLSGTP